MTDILMIATALGSIVSHSIVTKIYHSESLGESTAFNHHIIMMPYTN